MYEKELELYIDQLEGRDGLPLGVSAEKQARYAIKNMIAIMAEKGLTFPNKEAYEAYKGSSNSNEKNMKTNIARIQKFFAWLEGENLVIQEKEKDLTSVDKAEHEDEIAEVDAVDPENVEAENASTEISEVKAPSKNKGGRPRLDKDGGIRSEKLTIYLTPLLSSKLHDWCDLIGSSCVNYIIGLLEKDLDTKDDVLKSFRKSRDEARSFYNA